MSRTNYIETDNGVRESKFAALMSRVTKILTGPRGLRWTNTVMAGLMAAPVIGLADTQRSYAATNETNTPIVGEPLKAENAETLSAITLPAGTILKANPFYEDTKTDIALPKEQTLAVVEEKFGQYRVSYISEGEEKTYWVLASNIQPAQNVQADVETEATTVEQETVATYVVIGKDNARIRKTPAIEADNILAIANTGDEFEVNGEIITIESEPEDRDEWYPVSVIKSDNPEEVRNGFVNELVVGDVVIKTKIQPSTGTGGGGVDIPPASQEITGTQPISPTTVVSETINPATETVNSPEQQLQTARLFNLEVASIELGVNNPVGLNSEGFPITEYKNGQWENVKLLTTAEFSAMQEIEGVELVKELPKQTAYANPDGTFVVKEITAADINAAKFSITDAGIYINLPLAPGHNMVMVWEGGIEYRADWKILYIKGERVTLSLASAYNDVHPTREIILRDKEKRDILGLHNGTIAETLNRPKRLNIDADSLAWYREYSFIGPNDEPILITDPAEYDATIKLDALVEMFFKMLKDYEKDGKILFPKLGQEVNVDSKVHITIHRFPDDEEGVVGWIDGSVSTLPEHHFQVNEAGELIIHLALAQTGSHNMSSVIDEALSRILKDEFEIAPDYMDMRIPIYRDLSNSIYDYIQLPDGTTAVVLPVYADLGNETTGQWAKDD